MSRRKERIAKEVLNAMNPDFPGNSTRRGERLAKKYTNKPLKAVTKFPRTEPTAAAKARAQAINKGTVAIKKKYPASIRSVVHNSKQVPVWGTPKPPTGVMTGKGKKPTRMTTVSGDTRNLKKPVIRSIARTTQDQPIRRPAPKATRDLIRQRYLSTDPVTRAGQVRNNARAMARAQKALPMAKLARAAKAANPYLLAAEAGFAIYKGVKRATGPGGKAFHGQFVDYTSKPTNRGKRGINY